MLADGLINKIDSTETYFDQTLSVAEEEHGSFCPKEGMFSLAEQVGHVAQTVDWFVEGMFSKSGFNMEFEELEEKVRAVNTLGEAKKWLGEAFERAREKVLQSDDDSLKDRIAPGPIMGGVPRYIAIGAISDHTAHHRGSIAVYLRLLGLEPPMPYA
jgi:uncharacterized damage-inducible protein DinB